MIALLMGASAVSLYRTQCRTAGPTAKTMEEPEAFLADTSAMESVREGIAEVAGVPKEWVSIQGRKASRRLQGSRRRLAANLELTYTIECPADSTSSTVLGSRAG